MYNVNFFAKMDFLEDKIHLGSEENVIIKK